MKFQNLHRWDLSPKEAMGIQNELRERVIKQNSFGSISLIAGADICLDEEKKNGYAGVIIFTFPELIEVERQWAECPISFAYIPGLLAFREAPILLEAFAKLENEPDLVIFDGQGLAHPRRLGIASHLGIILDKPSIGCAKSLLIGTYQEPGEKAGSSSPLMDSREEIGLVLRTRDSVAPIFVSIGHKIDLPTCKSILLQCCDGVRIPKPTREADHFVAELKSGKLTRKKDSSSQLSLF